MRLTSLFHPLWSEDQLKISAALHKPAQTIHHSSFLCSSRRWSCTSPVSRRSWVWRSATGRTTRRILGFMSERWWRKTSSLHSAQFNQPPTFIFSLRVHKTWTHKSSLIQLITFSSFTFIRLVSPLFTYLLHPSTNHSILYLTFESFSRLTPKHSLMYSRGHD